MITFAPSSATVSGALLALESKATGWRIQCRPETGLSFRLLVPLPDRRNNQVLGRDQTLSEATKAPDGRSVRFVWRNLLSEHGGPMDITFTGVVCLGEDGLKFEGEVANRSGHTVECAYYPCLGDLAHPEGCESFAHFNYNYGRLEKHGLFPNFSGERGYWGVDRPTHMSAYPDTPFAMLASPEEGLYVGCHDTSVRNMVAFMAELYPGPVTQFGDVVPAEAAIGGPMVRIEFNVVHFPYVQPGETTALAPIVLKAFRGTWHKGVDCYTSWRKTWFKRPPHPQWVDAVHSWQQIHINSPEDELRCRYTELVKYGEDCAKHGVAAIQLVGWNHGGQDRGNPLHDPDPRLGTWQELKDAIEKIQAMGVKLILFSKFTWADRSTHREWFGANWSTTPARIPTAITTITAATSIRPPCN